MEVFFFLSNGGIFNFLLRYVFTMLAISLIYLINGYIPSTFRQSLKRESNVSKFSPYGCI